MGDGWTRAIDKLHHQAWTTIQQSYRHQTDLERGPNNKIKIKQQIIMKIILTKRKIIKTKTKIGKIKIIIKEK